MRRATAALVHALLLAGPALGAGNVQVTLLGGSVRIAGDAAANAVHVVPGSADGALVIEPFDADTTVNDAAAPLTVSGVTRGVRVELAEGADVLVVEDAELPTDLEVLAGAGPDHVELDDAAIARNLRIACDGDDDSVVVGTTSVGGRLQILGDSGNDTIELDLAFPAGRVKIATGIGDDRVVLGGGCTLGSDVGIATNAGADAVTIDDATFERNLRIALGGGADALSIGAATCDGRVALSGGEGVDAVVDAGGNTFATALVTKKFETPL